MRGYSLVLRVLTSTCVDKGEEYYVGDGIRCGRAKTLTKAITVERTNMLICLNLENLVSVLTDTIAGIDRAATLQ